ncbi:uncharacterized protein LOC136713037 [Amia ocellicauda]|uniref:uncharacterized protein LOC136713037 n=1 Tax=Amia ocellicauda TaxID=2972642 RepID=UPI003463D2DF
MTRGWIHTCVALALLGAAGAGPLVGLGARGHWSRAARRPGEESEAAGAGRLESQVRDSMVGMPRPRRRVRAQDSLQHQQEQCALMTGPWVEAAGGGGRAGQLYRLRMVPLSAEGPRRAVFPEQPLFQFVRRVYRCCQLGFSCRTVKGIQGRMTGDAEVQFVVSGDVFSVSLFRAELHLQLSNPHRLRVEPLLTSQPNHATRFAMSAAEGRLDLTLDLLFLFPSLQESAGGHAGLRITHLRREGGRAWGATGQELGGLQEPPPVTLGGGSFPALDPELGLALRCFHGDTAVPCAEQGVHLLHAPFLALSYR